MAKSSFILGKGTVVEIALPIQGDRTTPVRATLTTGSTATAKDITGDAEITLAAALPANVKIAAGNYLGFVSPTDGKTVAVQLKEDAVEGDATLTVESIPEAIAPSSVAKFPLRLAGRTAANLGRSADRTSVIDFDSDGYSDGLASSLEQTLEAPGQFVPTDAGYATAEFAMENLREVYVWLTLPKPSAAYSKGRAYHGPASITDLPVDSDAGGVITGNASFTYNGKPYRDAETPVA